MRVSAGVILILLCSLAAALAAGLLSKGTDWKQFDVLMFGFMTLFTSIGAFVYYKLEIETYE